MRAGTIKSSVRSGGMIHGAAAEKQDGSLATIQSIPQSPLAVEFKMTALGYRPEPFPTADEYLTKYFELYGYHMGRKSLKDTAHKCVYAYLTRALWPGVAPPECIKGGTA